MIAYLDKHSNKKLLRGTHVAQVQDEDGRRGGGGANCSGSAWELYLPHHPLPTHPLSSPLLLPPPLINTTPFQTHLIAVSLIRSGTASRGMELAPTCRFGVLRKGEGAHNTQHNTAAAAHAAAAKDTHSSDYLRSSHRLMLVGPTQALAVPDAIISMLRSPPLDAVNSLLVAILSTSSLALSPSQGG